MDHNDGYLMKRCSNSVFFIIFYLMTFDFWFVSFITFFPGNASAKKKELHIGGMFPISGTGGWQGGQACKPATLMALEDVNKNPDLLSDYTLKLHWNDSECESGKGAAVMYDLLYNDPVKVILLVGCSTVCTTVAEAAKKWNLIVLCYGARSPALSNRNRFETFFRTHPSATVHNPTRIKLMQKFGWSRIAILMQTEEVFISTAEDLEERCKTAKIEIHTRVSFLTDPADAVRSLARQDARIVVGLFYVAAARKVLCEVYKQNLFGKQYVWLFNGWYEDNWYETNLEKDGVNCTREEMKRAAEGHLTTEAVMWNQDNRKTISGMTKEDFRERLHENLLKDNIDINNGRYPTGYQEAPVAYDAVWALALAFNQTISKLAEKGKKLEEFSYTNREIRDELYSALNTTSFLGISGKIAFSEKGDRITSTQVEQMIDGKYCLQGYYDTENHNFTWYNREQWIGRKAPHDRTIVKKVLRKVSSSLFISMSTLAGVEIVWAIILILFTYIYRDRKVVKFSSPMTNTLMLIGQTLCLVSVFLIGLDGQFMSEKMFTVKCTLKKWILSVGFTLGYGAMFSKVWRAHKLTTRNTSATMIQPKKLYLLVATPVGIDKSRGKDKNQPSKFPVLVATLLAIEIVYLTVWTVVNPLRKRVEVFALEAPIDFGGDDDIYFQPQLEHCESSYHNIWLGITYSVKGVLLLFGLFLAYETRNINVQRINDSRLVGMSIYNVAVLCLITAPVTMIISSQQDASFALVALAIIFSSMITMGLVYIPKVVEVIREGIRNPNRSSARNNDATKEEEERYQKLTSENEQLQKVLNRKEVRLRQLRQKFKNKNEIRKLEMGEDDAEVDTNVEDSTKSSKECLKNKNDKQSEVMETYYVEPSDAESSAIGPTTSTTEFESETCL